MYAVSLYGKEVSMARQNYSEETKAAVMAALLTGQSVSEAAKTYRVPEATIRSWKSRQGGNDVASVATQKRERIGELLVSYLEEGLTTLQEQVRVFRNEEWLKKQGASELAVLHGVIADKQIRLLEALAGDEEESEEHS